MNSPPPTVPATSAPYDGVHGAACALVSVLLGLTQSLTVFGVNNNLPTLQGALGATAVEVSWLSTAYFATALSAVVLSRCSTPGTCSLSGSMPSVSLLFASS
jgi:hypothetical protein